MRASIIVEEESEYNGWINKDKITEVNILNLFIIELIVDTFIEVPDFLEDIKGN